MDSCGSQHSLINQITERNSAKWQQTMDLEAPLRSHMMRNQDINGPFLDEGWYIPLTMKKLKPVLKCLKKECLENDEVAPKN